MWKESNEAIVGPVRGDLTTICRSFSWENQSAFPPHLSVNVYPGLSQLDISTDWFCWENLQETMVFTIKYRGFRLKCSHHPILWISMFQSHLRASVSSVRWQDCPKKPMEYGEEQWSHGNRNFPSWFSVWKYRGSLQCGAPQWCLLVYKPH